VLIFFFPLPLRISASGVYPDPVGAPLHYLFPPFDPRPLNKRELFVPEFVVSPQPLCENLRPHPRHLSTEKILFCIAFSDFLFAS
jgi:hypothetical protein